MSARVRRACSGVYALNAATGAVIWGSGIGAGVFSSPAVAAGVVYVGSANGGVYALSAATGVKLWSSATAGEVLSSPAVSDGTVYVGSQDNSLYTYNLDAGTQAPRRPGPASLRPDPRLVYHRPGAPRG